MFSTNRKTKRFICLIMAIALSLTVGVPAMAVSEGAEVGLGGGGMITPMWTNTSSLTVGLSFSGSMAVCGAVVIGHDGVNQITGAGVLARRNSDGTYTTVHTWTGLESDSDILTFDGVYYVTTGYTYRFTFMAVVVRDGVGEYVSGYHEAYAG